MKPITDRQTIGEILELTTGLQQPINLEEVKRNYKRLVKKYHPDVNKTPEAAEYMKLVNRAYAIATGKEPIPQQPVQPPQQPVVIIRYYTYGTSSIYTSGTSTGWW